MRTNKTRDYNGVYFGENLNHVAFPLGGLGAGMFCLEGTGALSHFSIRNRPEIFNEPCLFSAISVKGEKNIARVLEGPVHGWKIFGLPGTDNGAAGKTYGFPRFGSAKFYARFPFAFVSLKDPGIPLLVEITGWSPFIPGDANNSSLPVAALEYNFTNPTDKPIEAVYSFHSVNFMATGSKGSAVRSTSRGFILWQSGSKEKPWEQGGFCASVDHKKAGINCAWFRGGLVDTLTMEWRDIEKGLIIERPPISESWSSPGASIYVLLQIAPGEKKTVRLMFSWHVPKTDIGVYEACDCSKKSGDKPDKKKTYSPWYSSIFPDIKSIASYWRANYDGLRQKSLSFSNCFYDTTLPAEVVEAVSANLTILKSPTVLRQIDGRLWGWEGCFDNSGCCHGSCTHVWNYAQAMPNLFPELERTLRHTEFNENQDKSGCQTFRAFLPICTVTLRNYPAADGQLGGIMKVYRDWRISGDTEWLRGLWQKVKASLNYCIETWDPRHKGVLEEPHHNTYDIEFWGTDSMCTSIYLGALKSAIAMSDALGDKVPLYAELLNKGCSYLEKALYNGEYFYQKVQWKGLCAKSPLKFKTLMGWKYSPEAIELVKKEGPKYQYGRGCLSDGVIGLWMADVCGLNNFIDGKKVRNHLRSVYRYNFKKDLTGHVNPVRPGYALGKEGGLLLCTWPKGGRPTLPFAFSDEVWTGIEYQVASHLMMHGMVKEGLEIVRRCRDRYDGTVRNPYDEYECGHWYARAMSSYALLQGLSGIRYDAVEKVLYIKPVIKGDFRAFISTATGYGTAGLKNGKPFIKVKHGKIDIERIKYDKQEK